MIAIDGSQQPILEYFFYKYDKHTYLIYRTVLVSFMIVIILLPLIKVTVSVQSPGIVRPVSEKTEVKSLVSETVEYVYVKENQCVKKGQPLIQLRNSLLKSQQSLLVFQQEIYLNNLHDLNALVKNNIPVPFRSSLYEQVYASFQQQLNELQNKMEKASREYERNLKLYRNGVLAEKDLDDLNHQLKLCENEIAICRCNYFNKLQEDLMQNIKLLRETEMNLNKQFSENELYIIRAPVSGTIVQFSGIFQGSCVQTNQIIAVISPDSTLISEVYVNPNDIGLIHPKSEVIISVNAFNYNEWGLLKGKVIDISSDYVLKNDNTPVFRIRCNMDRNWLCLKNGTIGNLRKGMTVQARFIIAKRSLFQLLYQNINDWINPIQSASF